MCFNLVDAVRQRVEGLLDGNAGLVNRLKSLREAKSFNKSEHLFRGRSNGVQTTNRAGMGVVDGFFLSISLLEELGDPIGM